MSVASFMANATQVRQSVHAFFGMNQPLFKIPERATSLELYLDRGNEKKNMFKKPEPASDSSGPVIPVRNLVLDENNRIIGAVDMGNKVRRLWPTSSAFLPRKEEIDPEIFESRLSAAGVMIPIVKDVLNKFFKKLRVDDVFSSIVIDTHLSTEKLVDTLAHFDLEDPHSIEKSVVAAMQAATYAHIVEKGFSESDLDMLAVDLNKEIISIRELATIDSLKQFEATARAFKAVVDEIGRQRSSQEADSAMAAAFNEVINQIKKT